MNNTGQTGGLYDADMDLPAAWSVTTGSMSTIVAVLDTGVDYTHDDLYLNIWLNQGEIPVGLAASLTDTDADGLITFRDLNDPVNATFVSDLNGTGYIDGGDLLADPTWEDGVDTDGNGFVDDLVGWDFVGNDNDPTHDVGQNAHGTRMAGIIGAIGDNGVGVAGVNWQVRVMPLRTGDEPLIVDINNPIAGLNYAVANGATISSNIYRYHTYSQGLYDAIASAQIAGHLVVAGAGNQSSDLDSGSFDLYPTEFTLDNIITAAAVDENAEMPSYSNYGLTSIDLATSSSTGVGTGILSTTPVNVYHWGGATSSATAHLAGVAALLRSLHPTWTYSQIKAQILSTVDPLPSLDGKTVTGGRLNAAAAVSASSIHVSGPSIVEGNSGTTELVFTVSRRGDTSEAVTLDWSTADGTAAAGSDYLAASGTLEFLTGETSKTISVQIIGDGVSEQDETLLVNLSLVTGNVLVADSVSQGTILNDDTASPNDIYVWDIAFKSRTRGRGGSVHDEQIVVTVRRDSDADGVAEASDELVAGANVTVVLTGPVGGTYSGVTNSLGVFTSAWLKDLPDGTYTAEVTGLTHATFTWNGALDPTANDTDSDGNGLPDESHTIPHGAAAASTLLSASTSSTSETLAAQQPIDLSSGQYDLSSDAVDGLMASAIGDLHAPLWPEPIGEPNEPDDSDDSLDELISAFLDDPLLESLAAGI